MKKYLLTEHDLAKLGVSKDDVDCLVAAKKNTPTHSQEKINNIILLACMCAGVDKNDMLSGKRTSINVCAKMLICNYLHENLKMGYKPISRVFGMDHSSIMHLCRKHKDLVEMGDKFYLAPLRKFRRAISSNPEMDSPESARDAFSRALVVESHNPTSNQYIGRINGTQISKDIAKHACEITGVSIDRITNKRKRGDASRIRVCLQSAMSSYGMERQFMEAVGYSCKEEAKRERQKTSRELNEYYANQNIFVGGVSYRALRKSLDEFLDRAISEQLDA